jgi:hypothetical protein
VAGNVPGVIGVDDQVELTIADPTPSDVRHSITKAFKRDASLDAGRSRSTRSTAP